MTNTTIKLPRSQRISHALYTAFRHEYERGKYEGYRFGQAFMNKFVPTLAYAELYYERNKSVAEKIIYENFIKFDR